MRSADATELSCPAATPVLWTAKLRQGVVSHKTDKPVVEVRHRLWIDARNDAAEIFGVEPGDIEVVLKGDSK